MSNADLWKSSLYDLNVSRLYDEIKAGLQEFKQENLLNVCLASMKLAENYNLEGSQKKELVLAVLRKLCKEYGVNEELLNLVAEMIDKFVSIDNREIRIAGRKVCCY